MGDSRNDFRAKQEDWTGYVSAGKITITLAISVSNTLSLAFHRLIKHVQFPIINETRRRALFTLVSRGHFPLPQNMASVILRSLQPIERVNIESNRAATRTYIHGIS